MLFKMFKKIGLKIVYVLITLLIILIYTCPSYVEAYNKRNYYLAMGDSIAALFISV